MFGQEAGYVYVNVARYTANCVLRSSSALTGVNIFGDSAESTHAFSGSTTIVGQYDSPDARTHGSLGVPG